MSPIQEIFKRYGSEYLDRFGDTLPLSHKKVIHAILNCRNGRFGTNLYQCSSCGKMHSIPCSCGNRHCPTCQHEKSLQWLEGQMQNLLPCPYFLITFTVPAQLRPFLKRHQKKGCALEVLRILKGNLIAGIDKENTVSQRLFKKAGFKKKVLWERVEK